MIFSTDFLLVHGREPGLYAKEKQRIVTPRMADVKQPMAQNSKYVVRFSNLSVNVEGKKLLSAISGTAKPGELLAVMGPSGSGKTTLLSALSGRIPVVDGGSISIAGIPLDKRQRRRIGYVTQQDVFFSDLTLRQTLEYTSALRLSDKLTATEKNLRVERIVDVLELGKCLDTVMGGGMKRGLSGGEKKRANIACELLTDPPVMLIDEPTSGLDSSTALSLVACLRNYAKQEQKTIILTIHQPSSQIFYQFDHLLLLCNGKRAFFGPVRSAVDHFCSIGLPIESHYNPADVIMEYLKGPEDVQEKIMKHSRLDSFVDQEEDCDSEKKDPARIHLLSQVSESWSIGTSPLSQDSTLLWRSDSPYCDCTLGKTRDHRVLMEAEPLNMPCVEEADSGRSSWSDSQSHEGDCSRNHSQSSLVVTSESKWPTSFWTQFKVLTRRNFREAKPRMLSRLNWIQTVGLGLMAGFLWLQLERKEENISDIQGWMFFSTTYWMLFALFGALASFPAEQEVVNKERMSGAYRLSAYYAAKMVGELPLIMTMPAVYYFISYPLMGIHNIYTFFQLLGFLLLNSAVAQSAGLFIGAICMDFQVSTTVSALYTLAMQLFGGFLATRVPPWLQWARSLSMIHYAFQSMQIVEFGNSPPVLCAEVSSRFSSCEGVVNGTITPQQIIEASGGPVLTLELNTLILLIFLVVFRTLGYLVLRFYRTPR